jgi:uncharacterized membrane protein
MNIQTSVDIRAEAKNVWDTWMDFERWPEWTRSIDGIQRLDSAGFGLGSRFRIRQPGIPAAIWTVTEFELGTSFTWGSQTFGIRNVATHRLEPRGGTASVTLTLVQTGWLARLIRSKAVSTAWEFLAMESQGLKRRCEG